MFRAEERFKPFEKKIWLSSPTMHGPELEKQKGPVSGVLTRRKHPVETGCFSIKNKGDDHMFHAEELLVPLEKKIWLSSPTMHGPEL